MAELTAESTSRFAELDWIKIHYNEAGADNGGVPIVLLHGAGAGATSWSNFALNIPSLAETKRVIAVDHPGYGQSDPYVLTDEPRTTINARAVAGLLDSLGIEKADLVGNSMGGATSLGVAVDFPHKLNRMVLMGSGGGGAPLFTVAPTEGIKALQKCYREPTFANFRAFFDVMLYDGSSVPDDVLRARAESVSQPHLDAWLQSLHVPNRNMALEIPGIQHEAMIIHGREDRTVPLEASLSLLSMLPNSELHVYKNVGHWVQYELGDRFTQLVLEFFNRP